MAAVETQTLLVNNNVENKETVDSTVTHSIVSNTFKRSVKSPTLSDSDDRTNSDRLQRPSEGLAEKSHQSSKDVLVSRTRQKILKSPVDSNESRRLLGDSRNIQNDTNSRSDASYTISKEKSPPESSCTAQLVIDVYKRSKTEKPYKPPTPHQNPQEEEDDSKDSKKSFRFGQLSRRDKSILLLLIATNFTHTFGYSLMSPFFPAEAKKKGVSTTVIGFIFSCFELVIFITSPLYGIFLNQLGVNFMFTAGIFVTGMTNILFGLLYMCPPEWFVPLCFLVRGIEALAVSAYSIASLTIASSTFRDNISTVFGLMETALGVGMMVGPLIGNLLYEAGGYGLPFYTLGGVITVMGIFVFLVFPRIEESPPEKRPSAFKLLKSGLVWITALTITAASFGLGFTEPSLSIQAHKVGIPSSYVGFLFALSPIVYAVMSPFWGWLTDNKGLCASLIIGGNLVSGISSLVLGPSRLLPFLPHAPWVIILALVLFGMSFGCAIMPTMRCLLTGANQVGFGDSLDTFGLVSGLFNTFYCLGSFLGPTVGGIIIDQLDFETACTLDSFIYFIAMFVSIVYFGCIYRAKKEALSNAPLLKSVEEEVVVAYESKTDDEFARPRKHRPSISSIGNRAAVPYHS